MLWKEVIIAKYGMEDNWTTNGFHTIQVHSLESYLKFMASVEAKN